MSNMTDYSTINMCGALYDQTHRIVFKILKKHADQFYMCVYLHQDDTETAEYVFRWDIIPIDVMDIYNYVNNVSKTTHEDNKVVIYGQHIGRTQNNIYRVYEVEKDTFDKIEKDINLSQSLTRDEIKKFSTIAEDMRIIKKLVQ